MIYLVSPNYQAAWAWCIANGVDGTDRTEVSVVTCMEHAHGQRPRPSDRIVRAHGLHSAELRQADLYLVHQQELARQRREISLRQAP